MKEAKLDISDYGIYLLSPAKLESFFKSEKIRSKKVLKYFQSNHEKYLKSISEGVWLPILPIDSVEYIIKVNDDFDQNWLLLREEKEFNLELLRDNDLWIGSISNLHDWKVKDYSIDKNHNSYETLDNETLYGSFRFNIPKGKYLVNIKGYKRKIELEYPNANYGYLFEFNKTENFEGFKDPREDDKYNFNIVQM